MKRMRHLILAGALLVGVSACGDDDEGSSDEPTATEAADSGDSGDSGSSEVAEYCAQVDDLAAQLEEVLADPTSGDFAALSAEATELIAAAQGLITANPDDVDDINACNERLTAAVSGG